MLIDEIRTVTGPMHKSLDESLYPHIQNIKTKEDYAKLLVAFYGYFKPVMEGIYNQLDESFLPDIHTRRKPESILQDLQDIGKEVATIPYAAELPQVTNKAQAIGAFYVMEGSTLGGIFLSKTIADNTGLQMDKGLSFFYGYGKESKSKWQLFVEALNNAPLAESQQQQAVEASKQTFSYFKKWLDKTYAHN